MKISGQINITKNQARSQKFAMEGLFWGLGADPPAAGGQWGSGGEALSRRTLGVWRQSGGTGVGGTGV